tara:strand:- start:184 stop:630 length:447 start_codon:yes stop_codon:yes gene_type:complete
MKKKSFKSFPILLIVFLFLVVLNGKVLYSLYQDKFVKEKPAPVQLQADKSEGVFTLESLVKEAEAHYDDDEKSRTDGFLWIDRSNSKYVVTLGAVNGVYPEAELTVYDGDDRVGEVIVDTSFDVISYVQPMGTEFSDLPNDYYKVVLE